MLKKEDKKKLKTANSSELTTKLMDLKKGMMNLRFQHSSGQLKDTSSLRKAKKNIAQVKTALNKGDKNA
jgi:large subunit ribosomal protein L29